MIKNLKKYQVEELSLIELKSIDGGSWLSRAFDTVVNALEDAYDWALERGVKLGAGKQPN